MIFYVMIPGQRTHSWQNMLLKDNGPDCSDHEVGELLLLLHGDPHAAIHLLAVLGRGPVLYAHYPEYYSIIVLSI